MNTIESISDIIHDVRISRGYTQADLAKLARVSRQTISKLESNPSDTKISSVERVLRCLELELVCRPARGHAQKAPTEFDEEYVASEIRAIKKACGWEGESPYVIQTL